LDALPFVDSDGVPFPWDVVHQTLPAEWLRPRRDREDTTGSRDWRCGRITVDRPAPDHGITVAVGLVDRDLETAVVEDDVFELGPVRLGGGVLLRTAVDEADRDVEMLGLTRTGFLVGEVAQVVVELASVLGALDAVPFVDGNGVAAIGVDVEPVAGGDPTR